VQFKSGSTSLRLAGAALFIALALLSGCKTRGNNRDLSRQPVDQLYNNARKALDANDYEYSTRLYEALTSRYPFSQQARQARLDLIFLYYRRGEKESAIDAAEQFLRENPTHPRCDYAMYMKGMINFERVPYKVERWLGVDMAKRPPTDVLAAVAAFGDVVSRYPKSEYAHDAQRRMIYLRNRLAEFEVNVAHYYIRRGAYLAAADRAQRAIEQYDGAPAIRDALEVMIEAYDHLGLKDLKANVEKVYAENYPEARNVNSSRSWWRFWKPRSTGS
jgi:outer membrane protein assembly factor BamD